MYKNAKVKAAVAKEATVTIFKNVLEFTQAVSLVVVAVVSGIAAKQGHIEVSGVYGIIVASAVAVIAIMAALFLVRHFNK